jgi:aerobic carbon-monoxide dehydrogenase large subunit
VDVLVTEDAPSPLNPLGIKSVGEGGINEVGAVIDEEIGSPGVATQLPATPQRLRTLVARQRSASSAVLPKDRRGSGG